MLLELLGAAGVILVLTALTVFLPAWALSGSARRALGDWGAWVGCMAALMVPGALIGALWAWLEHMRWL